MDYPRRLLAIFILLILHQNLFSSADAWGNVELTCKKAAAKGIDFHFCVKTLQTIPKSSNAGTPDLAIAATKLAGKEFKHALNVVKKLLLAKVTDADKEALSVCSDAYRDGVDGLKGTITFIRSRSKFDAITYLSAALTDVTTCDDAFEDFGNKALSPKRTQTPAVSPVWPLPSLRFYDRLIASLSINKHYCSVCKTKLTKPV